MCIVIEVFGKLCFLFVFFFKQKTAYEMRISDWSSDVCSSDLIPPEAGLDPVPQRRRDRHEDVEHGLLAGFRPAARLDRGHPGLDHGGNAPAGGRRVDRKSVV